MDAENTISIQADLFEEMRPGIALMATALTLIIVLEKIGKIRSQT